MAAEGKQLENPGAEPAKQHSALGWEGGIGSLILIILSIIFMVGALNLGLGVPTRLGTGAFPFLAGAVLAVLAAAICIEEWRGGGLAETPDWIGFLAITAALAIFAVTADRLGLVPAAFLTVFISSLPDRSLPLIGKAVLGCIVAVASWALFIRVLNLPFKAFAVF